MVHYLRRLLQAARPIDRRSQLRLLQLERRLTPVNVPNVLVNDPSADTTTANTQSETSTVVFPDEHGITVVSAFNDFGSNIIPNQFHKIGFARSTDGGKSFTDGGSLPGT